MRALVIYCHPNPNSYNAAVLEVVLNKLRTASAEIRLSDLYARGFEPSLSQSELEIYLDHPENMQDVARDVADIQWCDTLIFVYPTWWYGLPALLKGWLDRVLVPQVAFLMPDAQNADIRPGLTHITRMGVFTTCGASWWLTRYVGAPGRRTLLRGVKLLCAKRCRTAFVAHYLMDSSTPTSRERHLGKVAGTMDKLIRGAAPKPQGRTA